MVKRLVIDFVLLISIFIFPWWISLFLMLIGIFVFNNYYEFIGAAMIMNSLYSVEGNRLISSPIFFTALFILIYILIQFVKTNIILYNE